MKRTFFKLFLIVVLGLILRFYYYPNDIFFAYDQARDAFISQKIFSGDLKILGPPASTPGLHHGALSYYVFGILYGVFGNNPVLVSLVMRVFNVLGVLILYRLVKNTLGNKCAIITSIIFAVSFEQSQYSLFLGHPAFAVITVLLFYFGIAEFYILKKKRGFWISATAFALSIQFHISLIMLAFPLLIFSCLAIIKDRVLKIKDISIGLLLFLMVSSTYLLSELKFNFQNSKAILSVFMGKSEGNFLNLFSVFFRFIRHNLLNSESLLIMILLFIMFLFGLILLIRTDKTKRLGLVLLVWFITGVFPYIKDTSVLPIYYYTIGGSISVIIVFSFLISKYIRSKILTILTLLVIFVSNALLIKNLNKFGTIVEISAQDEVLLKDEIRVLDYMYQQSSGCGYSVNALTIPYNVKTTWDYLFNWYGIKKYGCVPTWGGWAASGYEGDMSVNTKQSELPETRYTILEPERGMPGSLKEKFIENENIFWEIRDEVKFGKFTVQKRTRRI